METSEKVFNNNCEIAGGFSLISSYLKLFGYSTVWLAKQLTTKHRKMEDIPKRSGEIAVITGGNKGIGAQVVKNLLKADMRVIIGCRDTVAGERLIKQLRSEGVSTGSTKIIFLDLQSFQSVKTFAKTILSSCEAIHILFNHAGVSYKYGKTMDGFDKTIQVNYLSHFLLTLKLLPALARAGKEGGESRIVNTSSILSLIGKVNLKDFLMEKYWNETQAYSNSKLFQVLMSNYLNKWCEEEKLPVKSFSVHPGIVDTDVIQNATCGTLYSIIFKLFAMPVEKGGDGIIWTALSKEADLFGGKMTFNCGPMRVNPLAENVKLQEKMWEKTAKLLGLDWAVDTLIPVEEGII